MYQQRVKGRPVSGAMGVLIVVGIALSIVLVSWIEQAIGQVTGLKFGAVLWVIVVVEAVAVMRLSIMAYRYTLTDGRFFIERVYGDHARIVYDIPESDILAVGDQGEVFAQYGNGQAYSKAVMKHNNLAVKAMAYRGRDDSASQLLVFQPDEEMLARLTLGLAQKTEV